MAAEPVNERERRRLGDPETSPERWPCGSSADWGVWVGCPGGGDLPESSEGKHEAGLLYPESSLGSGH